MAHRVKVNGAVPLCVAGRVDTSNAAPHKNRRWLSICRHVIEHSTANLPKASRYNRQLRPQRGFFPIFRLSPSRSRIALKIEGLGGFWKSVWG